MRNLLIRLVTGSLLAAAVVASLVLPGHAQRDVDWSKITYKVHKLAEGVYMLEGQGGFAGGNIGVSAGPDGLLIVDSGFPQLSAKIQAELKKLGDKPLKYVINTHVHGDHTAGNTVFGAQATVIAHENTRSRLIKGGFGDDGKSPAPAVALPVITMKDELQVHLNGQDITATHMPSAHTDTDVVVRFGKTNVVHLGDLFFNGSYAFIDPSSGGSLKGYIADLEQLVKELPADVKIIPGHGPPGTVKDLQASLTMIKETSAIVEKAMAGGKSLDELKKAKLLAKYDKAWGQWILSSDDYTEILYTALKK